MFEITSNARLVGYASNDGQRWQLQHKIDHRKFSKREIWQPVNQLMSSEQTLSWLSCSAVTSATVEQFRHIAGLS